MLTFLHLYFINPSDLQTNLPRCEAFPGTAETVFEGFEKNTIQPPKVSPGTPKVALVTGKNSHFRFNKENTHMPLPETFLIPLDVMDGTLESSTLESPLSPDFRVLIMPPAVLHSKTSRQLSNTLMKMLKQGLNVRVMLMPLDDLGIAQQRKVLTIIATPFQKLIELEQPDLFSKFRSKTVKDIVGDLSYLDAGQDSQDGFVCLFSRNNGAGGTNNPVVETVNLYNHGTGKSAAGEKNSLINMGSQVAGLSSSSSRLLVHPGKFSWRTTYYNSLSCSSEPTPIFLTGTMKLIFSRPGRYLNSSRVGPVTRVPRRLHFRRTTGGSI